MAQEAFGKIIGGKYRLRSLLGKGGMGIVYRAEQLDVEGQPLREVALKMIQLEFSRDPNLSRRFLREVRVAASLRSPNALIVYDSGLTQEGQPYFAMELVRGPTLREVLQREKILPVERVVSIIGQVCKALAEAHSLSESVVHRDLKPENIFLEKREGQDWVKIGDFGIAKVLEKYTRKLTRPGAPPGTPRYMAPEQWAGKEVDGRTDLYALGVMMYEMLAGKPPFSDSGGRQALMDKHLRAAPPPLPTSIPVGIRTLVTQQLLAKTPQERPSDALSVRRALETALVGREGGKKPKSAARWAYKSVVGLIVLALLVGGGLWYRSQLSTEERPQPPEEKSPDTVPPRDETSHDKAPTGKILTDEEEKRLKSIQEGREEPLELVTLGFTNTTKDGEPLSEPADLFAASELQFVEWQVLLRNRLQGLVPAYHRVEATYFALNGQPMVTVQDAKEVSAEDEEVLFTGRVGRAAGGAFAPGTYVVDFYLNDLPLTSLKFEVKGDTTQVEASESEEEEGEAQTEEEQ